jgi:SAM-dependent methyltransferase
MILPKLLHLFFTGRGTEFYELQARDAIRWLDRVGVKLQPGVSVIDLGCGHGIFGAEFMKKGCEVTFADQRQYLAPELQSARFVALDIDRDDFNSAGKYDLVICSNVLEHLAQPERFVKECSKLIKDDGLLYLSWTNWLSPFGGHDFAPLHYLGGRRGQWLFDKLIRKHRNHTIYENLFPTYIGRVLKWIRQTPDLVVLRSASRYYTEFSFVTKIPVAREFLSWNCALLIGKRRAG